MDMEPSDVRNNSDSCILRVCKRSQYIGVSKWNLNVNATTSKSWTVTTLYLLNWNNHNSVIPFKFTKGPLLDPLHHFPISTHHLSLQQRPPAPLALAWPKQRKSGLFAQHHHHQRNQTMSAMRLPHQKGVLLHPSFFLKPQTRKGTPLQPYTTRQAVSTSIWANCSDWHC